MISIKSNRNTWWIELVMLIAELAGTVEYTDCFSAER